jgi:hypothetical protein
MATNLFSSATKSLFGSKKKKPTSSLPYPGYIQRSDTPYQKAMTSQYEKWNRESPGLAQRAMQIYTQNPGKFSSPFGVAKALSQGGSSGGVPAVTPRNPGSGGSSGGGGRGYSYGRGGGGGGGGGGGAAAGAQGQLDFLLGVLGSKSYTAPPETALRQAIAARQAGVTNATRQDLATANKTWGELDTWLRQNQSNPYANVKLQTAPTAPDYNPYLATQGVAPLNQVRSNPEDPYGGFANVLKLLGANQLSQNQSQAALSRMGRAASVTGINAMDNAFDDAIKQQLAAVAQKEYENQQALEQERRAAVLQLAPLLAQGAKAPADVLVRLGLAPKPVVKKPAPKVVKKK